MSIIAPTNEVGLIASKRSKVTTTPPTNKPKSNKLNALNINSDFFEFAGIKYCSFI